MKFKPGDILMHKEVGEIVEILMVLNFMIEKGGGYLITCGDACYPIGFYFIKRNYVKIGEV
jgi:hypothetical protein